MEIEKKEKKMACLAARYDDKEFLKRNTLDKPEPDADKILEYLEEGEFLYCMSVEVVSDKTGKKCGIGLNVYTDGEYIWDSLLVDYMHSHHFKVEDSFVKHMRDNNWHVPDLERE
ncbi:hypothetical protein FACS189454_03010 [Planctomycetales bacterium]|nr:hypothetical protein FACS189454_03010 [Planctomycetales bacterium]